MVSQQVKNCKNQQLSWDHRRVYWSGYHKWQPPWKPVAGRKAWAIRNLNYVAWRLMWTSLGIKNFRETQIQQYLESHIRLIKKKLLIFNKFVNNKHIKLSDCFISLNNLDNSQKIWNSFLISEGIRESYWVYSLYLKSTLISFKHV